MCAKSRRQETVHATFRRCQDNQIPPYFELSLFFAIQNSLSYPIDFNSLRPFWLKLSFQFSSSFSEEVDWNIRTRQMEAHARSLLERLNTTSSPKPLSKSSTPEPKWLAAPLAVHPIKESSQDSHISTLNQLSTDDMLDDPEDSMSVKDLLVSARHRSRETSTEAHAHLADNSADNGIQHTDIEDPHSGSQPESTSKKDNHEAVLDTSDGDSIANPESPTTPSASNNSSLVSNGAENSDGPISHPDPPHGLRIVNSAPSIVSLPHMKCQIPRLQINTDPSGRTFTGEGIEQIANLVRSFGHYDRDIISATSKYIVHALKGAHQLLLAANNLDGRIRIIDQNTGTRAIAETQSMASVISLDIRDGSDSEESFLLVLDTSHDLTIWSIKPWKVDSADVPYISISIMVNL
jgi:hypothetical protein